MFERKLGMLVPSTLRIGSLSRPYMSQLVIYRAVSTWIGVRFLQRSVTLIFFVDQLSQVRVSQRPQERQ